MFLDSLFEFVLKKRLTNIDLYRHYYLFAFILLFNDLKINTQPVYDCVHVRSKLIVYIVDYTVLHWN